MDWAYLLSAVLGIAVAAVVGLVAPEVFGSLIDTNQIVRAAGALASGIAAGAMICAVTYWFLHPLIAQARAASR